jgi:hypothetical protein
VTVEELWDQAQRALADSGIPVFPDVPARHGSVQMEIVVWPDGEDPAAFVAFLRRVAPTVVYAAAEPLGVEDLDDFGRRLGHMLEASELLAEVRSRFGQLWRASVAFAVSGVLHVWEAVAPWYEEIEEHAAVLEDSMALAEAEHQQRQLIDLAVILAHDPAFAQARNDADRRAALAELRPESELWPSGLRGDILGRAKRIFSADVLPGIEQDLAEQARALIVSGMSRRQAARVLDMGDDRLARILARHPADE